MRSFISLMVRSKIGPCLTPILLGIPHLLSNIRLIIWLLLNIPISMSGLDNFKKLKQIKIKNLLELKKEK